MKYYIIAGEASGDLHGSNLVRSIVAKDTSADIRFWGGEKMLEAGAGKAVLVKHYKDLAYMGFWEVLTHLRVILGNMAFCKKDIDSFRPDVIIFIDYPGFNLRMASYASKKGYKAFYYIAPQIWAWHTSRVKQIKRYIQKVYAVLPFEPDFYAKYGVEAEFLGHPLLDAMARYEPNPNLPIEPLKEGEKLITLMPGSRKQEINKIFPVMLKASSHFPEYRFVVAATSSIDQSLYEKHLKAYPHIKLVYDRAYDLLSASEAAMVKSGTATLETAILQIPEVVCYKTSYLSYKIARYLVKNLKFISLVNLILDREVVRELLQEDLTEGILVEELGKILKDTKIRERQLSDYKELVSRLGNSGVSDKIANSMINNLRRL